MTALLVRLLVKDYKNIDDPDVRLGYGKAAGIVGIVTNLVLFAAKLLLGFFSGSISIMADSINNLTDSASSVITLVGFKLSGKPADEDHPYGHARYEYITGFVVSLLVILIGFEFLKSSVEKIISPEPITFSWLLAGILAGSVLLKIWQGSFYRSLGKKIESAALLATAADSRNDVITTSVVLVGCIVAQYTNLLLDGWLGLLVAVFILISGIGLAKEILDPLLGTAPDKQLVDEIEAIILSHPSILGVHDLLVHTYGAGRVFASAHVEVPAEQDALLSHEIIDRIERKVSKRMNVQLVIHADPVEASGPMQALREGVTAAASEIDPVLQVHDIRLRHSRGEALLLFEVTAPPAYHTGDDDLRVQLHKTLQERGYPYDCVITVDRSYTSTTGRMRC